MGFYLCSFRVYDKSLTALLHYRFFFTVAAIMASDEQFSLCWNNFHANMSAGFHGLLSRGDLVDVTLAAEGRLLQAHKLVLSVCSPYFQEMFKMNPTQHPIGMYLERALRL